MNPTANIESYPVFEPNQVLSESQLNSVFNYLDEQERLTRVNLIGIGIVCGLNVKLTVNGSGITVIELSGGMGNTTEGYLITEAMDVTLTHYRGYVLPTDIDYDLFRDETKKQYPLWELFEPGAVNETMTPLPPQPDNPATGNLILGDKVLLLFLELKKEERHNCLPTNCDEKGLTVNATVRRLLIEKMNLDKILAGEKSKTSNLTAADIEKIIDDRLHLPDLRLPRYNVPATKPSVSQEVIKAFLDIFQSSQIVTATGNALIAAYEAFQPILVKAFPSNPFTGFTGRFDFLEKSLQNREQALFLQYYYDFFHDLILAYDEFRWKGAELLCAGCLPDGYFPRHLMAGVLNPALHTGHEKYRHPFLESPALNRCKDQITEFIPMVKRIVTMIDSFTNEPPMPPVIANLDTDNQIRITPDRIGDIPLSKKSIPYYYNPSQNPPLYQLWSPEKKRRSRINQNLSYHADRYSPMPPDFVLNPLSYDMEPYNFLRIEGHLGKNYRDTLNTILNWKENRRLPIQIVALRAGEYHDSISVDLSAEMIDFPDLEAIYDTLREELLATMCEGVRYLYDVILPNSKRTGGTPKLDILAKYAPGYKYKPDSVGAWYEEYLDRLDAKPYIDINQNDLNAANLFMLYCGLFWETTEPDSGYKPHIVAIYYFSKISEILPASLKELGFDNFKNRYEDLISMVRYLRSEEMKNIPNVLQPFVPREELIDHFDYVLYSCKLEPIQALYEEIELRIQEIKKKQFLGNFLQRHPGIEHKAGVPLGGTFILVYTGDITLASAPAVSSWGSGRLDLFIRDKSDQVKHSYFDGHWSNWESFSGKITSNPAAVSWENGRVDLFARAENNELLHRYFDQGWSGWHPLGGICTSGPAVSSWGKGRLDVFVRGTDNALWHKWYQGGWSGWESLGGGLTSDPAVVSWGEKRIDVFVRGTDGALWHKWYDNHWSHWESLGGDLSSGPAVSSWSAGRLDVFVRGTDNALWHKWYQSGWSGWESLGGTLTSNPAAVSWVKGRIDVFARDVNHAVIHKWFQGQWSNWETLDGDLNGDSGLTLYSTAGGANDDVIQKAVNNLPVGTVIADFYLPYVCCPAGSAIQFVLPKALPTFTAQIGCTNSERVAKVVIKARGGDSPYMIKNNDQPYEDLSETFNLTAGTYTITIMDSAGSESISQTYTIPEPLSVSDPEYIDDIDKQTYQVRFLISGGKRPYQVNSIHVPGDLYTSPPIMNNDAFQGKITDSAGCGLDVEYTHQVPVRPTFTVELGCTNNKQQAEATITPVTGEAPFAYSLDDKTYTQLNNPVLFPAGESKLIIKDSLGLKSQPETINVPEALIINNPQYIENIDNQTYRVQFLVSGGVKPWTTPDGTIDGNGTFISQPIPSDKSVEISVTDSRNCRIAQTVQHEVPNPCKLPCGGIALRQRYWFQMPIPSQNPGIEESKLSPEGEIGEMVDFTSEKTMTVPKEAVLTPTYNQDFAEQSIFPMASGNLEIDDIKFSFEGENGNMFDISSEILMAVIRDAAQQTDYYQYFAEQINKLILERTKSDDWIIFRYIKQDKKKISIDTAMSRAELFIRAAEWEVEFFKCLKFSLEITFANRTQIMNRLFSEKNDIPRATISDMKYTISMNQAGSALPVHFWDADGIERLSKVKIPAFDAVIINKCDQSIPEKKLCRKEPNAISLEIKKEVGKLTASLVAVPSDKNIALTYLWRVQGAEPTMANGGRATFSFLGGGEYRIQLVAFTKEGCMFFASDTVTIG
jgi:hypothetical protein